MLDDEQAVPAESRLRSTCNRLLAHSLQRTAAYMIRAGIPEKRIMLIAGWKTRSMFAQARYSTGGEEADSAPGGKGAS